jgi:hypothetical protein
MCRFIRFRMFVVTRPRDDAMHENRQIAIHESREYDEEGKSTALDDELIFV